MLVGFRHRRLQLMTAYPAWLSFGSSVQPSDLLLVEFHQPLHPFVLLDGESGRDSGGPRLVRAAS